MNTEQTKQAVKLLEAYITPQKQQKITEVLALRTRYITVALENVFQPHNASAIVRSAECFGVQDIHTVEDAYRYKMHQGVARGSAYWVTRYAHPSMQSCFEELKKNGYRIIATTPHQDAPYIQELPLDHKVALVFGTELTGLSDYTLAHADGFVKIPMFGFTQSYNVSVSAAICLYELTKRLHASSIDWHVDKQAALDIKLQWYRRIVRGSDKLEKELLYE